ncbi:MAG: HAD-IA family hydrolase [Actinomycetota bacterium]|nr:HAD-IA family hydrolase [Actinomycetota bacterium]
MLSESRRFLCVDPEDCLVVEDAPAGIEAAHAAGMRAIALTTTHSAEAESAAEVCAQSLERVRFTRFSPETVDGHTKLSVTVDDRL